MKSQAITEAREKNKMIQPVEEHADRRLEAELLFFWSNYPCAKFTPGVIARALNHGRRVDIEEALEYLVEARLVERHTRQGQLLYSLSTDPEKRQRVLNLAAVSK